MGINQIETKINQQVWQRQFINVFMKASIIHSLQGYTISVANR